MFMYRKNGCRMNFLQFIIYSKLFSELLKKCVLSLCLKIRTN